MISDSKILGMTAQIDFGNFTVGLATICVAFVSFLVARWSKLHSQRSEVARLREEWIQDTRSNISKFISECYKIRTSGVLQMDAASFKEFYVNNVSDLSQYRSYIIMKLNKSEYFSKKIMQYMDLLYDKVVESRDFSGKQAELDRLAKHCLVLERILIEASWAIFNTEWQKIKDEIRGAWRLAAKHEARICRAISEFESFENKLKSALEQE